MWDLITGKVTPCIFLAMMRSTLVLAPLFAAAVHGGKEGYVQVKFFNSRNCTGGTIGGCDAIALNHHRRPRQLHHHLQRRWKYPVRLWRWQPQPQP